MLGIIIGVAALVTMLSLGAGASEVILKQIDSLGSDILMVYPSGDGNSIGANGELIRRVELSMQDVNAIRQSIAAAKLVAPAIRNQATVIFKDRNWVARINGTTSDYFKIRDWLLQKGRKFSPHEESYAGKVAIIGTTVANQLFGDIDPVGKEVRVLNVPMRIIGLLESKGSASSGRDQDDIIFVPYKTALLRINAEKRVLGPNALSYILVKVKADENLHLTKGAIESYLDQRHKVTTASTHGITVADPVSVLHAEQNTSNTITWFLAAIASISIIVGGISIMNIMLASVAERRREIGLLQALGARRSDVNRMFLMESLLICFVGGITGALIGILVSWLITAVLGWPILIVPWMVLLALISSCATGLVFGYVPAYRASNLMPAEALRS